MNKKFVNLTVNKIYGTSRGLLLPSDDRKSNNLSEIDFIEGTSEIKRILQKTAAQFTPLDLASDLRLSGANSSLVNRIIILETCANELRSYEGYSHLISEKGWRHLKEEMAELNLAKVRQRIDAIVDAVLDLMPLFLGQLLYTHHASDWTSYVRVAINLLHDEADVWHRLASESTYISWIDSMILRQRPWSTDYIPALQLATFVMLRTGGIIHPKLVSYDYDNACTEYFYPPEFYKCEESKIPSLFQSEGIECDGESSCCMH